MRRDRVEVDQAGERSSDDEYPRCKACNDNGLSGKLDFQISHKVDREHDDGDFRSHIDYAVHNPENALEGLAFMLLHMPDENRHIEPMLTIL